MGTDTLVGQEVHSKSSNWNDRFGPVHDCAKTRRNVMRMYVQCGYCRVACSNVLVLGGSLAARCCRNGDRASIQMMRSQARSSVYVSQEVHRQLMANSDEQRELSGGELWPVVIGTLKHSCKVRSLSSTRQDGYSDEGVAVAPKSG